MNFCEDSDERDAALVAACSDPSSEYYQKICKLLNDSVALAKQAKANAPYVTVPFCVSDGHIAALESQFDITIQTRKGFIRSRNTPRVAALLCVLDAALKEHAEAGGRSAFYVDGDLMHILSVGLENRVVERTHSHSRLASGYVEEDDLLTRAANNKTNDLRLSARVLLEEVHAGAGEHYSSKVRAMERRSDAVVFNHLKTPVGLAQAAYLVHLRGRVGYGVLPFQVTMKYLDKGRLEAFPGWFYVDRECDMITLVPDDDATMSISHPYSSLMSFVDNNSVIVDGHEFLCEKYAKAPGFLYYTLASVDGDFVAPETLRTYFYDSERAKVSKVEFPEVRYSDDGIPVGFARGEVLIPTLRLEKVVAKVMISSKPVVTPSDVAVVLINENNMVINTLDSAAQVERMDEMDQTRLSVAIALHVNWRRHAMQGTFNTLLNTMRLRHAAAQENVMRFAMLALSAWWQSPTLSGDAKNSVFSPAIADWCGNDFSVIIEGVNPWIEIASVESGDGGASCVVNHGLPRVPVRSTARKIRSMVSNCVTSLMGGCIAPKAKPVVHITDVSAVGDKHDGGRVWVTTDEVPIPSTTVQLTDLKKKLRDKMVSDQGAVNYDPVYEPRSFIRSGFKTDRVWTAVPSVDPISAIRGDLDDILGGLPERDAVRSGYDLAEVEEYRVTTGCLAINDAKRLLPKPRMIRRAKVDAGVEGTRVQTAMGTLAALFKRNIGIPSNEGAVDLDLMPDANVQRLAEVCFRPDWKSIVDRHIENGMWETNLPDVEDYMGKLEESKVKRMLDEFFIEGYVSLENWLMMAKGKIKPSREVGSESRVDHSQTILYLESMNTNGMYSSMLRRVKKCVDECLIENVKLNSQWSPQESEDWYNSLEPIRRSCGTTHVYDVDSTVFDRSQSHPALRTEMAFHKMLGLSEERFRVWEKVHGRKKAMSMMFGIVAFIVLTGVSGLWSTLYRNGVVQLVSVIVSADLRRGDIVTCEVKGDDVDLETRRPVRVETAVTAMSLAFNLASKFNTSEVRYFCKKFRIRVQGRWYEVADPWARVQSLCTPVVIDSSASASLVERWESLKADLLHYDNDVIISAAAEAAKAYYGLKIVPYGMVRGLAALVESKTAFMQFFKAPEMIF